MTRSQSPSRLAALMSLALAAGIAGCASSGTGASARRIVPAHIDIAGKTGTTNDNADVWFVGMTPTQQIAAFNQLNPHLPGQESMFKIRGIINTRSQQCNSWIRYLLRRQAYKNIMQQ